MDKRSDWSVENGALLRSQRSLVKIGERFKTSVALALLDHAVVERSVWCRHRIGGGKEVPGTAVLEEIKRRIHFDVYMVSNRGKKYRREQMV